MTDHGPGLTRDKPLKTKLNGVKKCPGNNVCMQSAGFSPTKFPVFAATAARKSLRFSGKTQNLAMNMSVLFYETINCFTESNQKARPVFNT